MRTYKVLFLPLLFTINSFSQNKIVQATVTDDKVEVTDVDNNVYSFYQDINDEDKLLKAIESNYLFETRYFFNSEGKVKEKQSKKFNSKMMNIFFSEEVSGYINDSKDLSLKRSYAVISTEDKTLFLGRSFELVREKKTDKLTHLFTLGLKAKLKDNFTTLFKNGDIQNDIGINLKYTWVGRGIIDFRGYERQIDNLKQEVIVPNNVKEVKDNIKNEVYEKEIGVYNKVYGADLPNKLDSFYEDKYEEIYSKMAEEEITFIRNEKLYNFLWDHYVTFEALLPVTERSYDLLPDVSQSTTSTETFMPWKTLLGYTSFWKKANEQIIYLSAFASVFNNNNAEIEKLDKFNLQQPNGTNSDVIEKTTEVFVGDFKQFVTTNIKIEGVTYFLRKGSIGLSGAIEQNFGEYDVLNWKLGMPFSLKDKEGKPTVNFELQWKEVNKNHFVGIGVGFAFGKFIN